MELLDSINLDDFDNLYLKTETSTKTGIQTRITTASSTTNKYGLMLEDLLSKKIIFKLRNNNSIEIDGRVVKFSPFLKNIQDQSNISI